MQRTTGDLKLNKIDLSDTPDITVLNPNFDKIDESVTQINENKVDKVVGKTLTTNDYTTIEKNKLNDIATNATKNDSDANLKNRANHTGTQPVSTITGLHSVATSGNYEQLTNKPVIPVVDVTKVYVDDTFDNHDLAWNGHRDMIGYYSDLVEKQDTMVDALNSHTNKINVLQGEDVKLKNEIGVLSERERVLESDRGYLVPKIASSVSSNLPTGIYTKWVSSAETPLADQFNFVRIQGEDPDFISTIGIHPVSGNMLTKANDSKEWQQLATTDKIDISSCLKNQWVVSGGPLEPVNAERIGNKVFLSGFIQGGITTANTHFMQLPIGFRPSATALIYVYDVFNPQGVYRADVYPSGGVVFTADAVSNINLNGCYFTV